MTSHETRTPAWPAKMRLLAALALPSAVVAAGMFWARDVRVAFLLYLGVGCLLGPRVLVGARPLKSGRGLPWRATRRPAAGWRHLAAWFLFGPVFLALYSVIRRFIGDPQRYLDLLRGLGWRDEHEAVYALLFVLLIPLAEEWWWRGQALPRCIEELGRGFGIFLAAFAYSAYHVFTLAALYDPRSTVVRWLGIFVAGVIWSVLALRWREWSAPYWAHLGADMAIIAAFFLFVT